MFDKEDERDGRTTWAESGGDGAWAIDTGSTGGGGTMEGGWEGGKVVAKALLI